MVVCVSAESYFPAGHGARLEVVEKTSVVVWDREHLKAETARAQERVDEGRG